MLAGMVAPKEGMDHMHGVDHAADNRLAVASYIHDVGDVDVTAVQETNKIPAQ